MQPLFLLSTYLPRKFSNEQVSRVGFPDGFCPDRLRHRLPLQRLLSKPQLLHRHLLPLLRLTPLAMLPKPLVMRLLPLAMLLRPLAKPLPVLLLMWATLPKLLLMQLLLPLQLPPLLRLPSKLLAVLGYPADKAGS